MLNEPRQRVTTYPGTGQVVTCMIGHWYALNVLYNMYYNYTGVLWNIQRILQQLQNINVDKKVDEFGHFRPAWWSKIYLFVALLENGRHLVFSIDQSDGMDLITIEMAHANFGPCITMCPIHPKNANYLLHSKSVTTCPDGNVTTFPNVISLTKFVIVEKYGVPYI